VEEHPLDQDALRLLALPLRAARSRTSATRPARSSRIRSSSPRPEQARAGEAHTGRAGRQARGDQRGRMLAFEVCDLVAERAPGGAFVDLLPERRLEHEAPPCGAANVPPASILPNPDGAQRSHGYGGLFIGRRPGTARVHYAADPDPGTGKRQRMDRLLAAFVLVVETLVCLTLWGPQPVGWLWVGSQVNYQHRLGQLRDPRRLRGHDRDADADARARWSGSTGSGRSSAAGGIDQRDGRALALLHGHRDRRRRSRSGSGS
jgi:hypothetical protein